jgi:hypothetical protein
MTLFPVIPKNLNDAIRAERARNLEPNIKVLKSPQIWLQLGL